MDEHGRPHVPITSVARQASFGVAPPTDEAFTADTRHEGDMQEDVYDTIIADRDQFPKMTPNSFHCAGLRWMAYLQAGSYDALSTAWLSLLLRPGQLAQSRSKAAAGIVIATSRYYVLLW
jgi:hypothetical protein